jgi:hypothetical protein
MQLRNKSGTTRRNDASPSTVNDGLDSSDDESFKPVFKSKAPTLKQTIKQSKRVLPTTKSSLKSHAKSKKGSPPSEDTDTKQPPTRFPAAAQKEKNVKKTNAKKRGNLILSNASDSIPLPPKKSIPLVAKMPSPTSSFSEDETPMPDIQEQLLPSSTDEVAPLAALPPLEPTRDFSPVQWLKDPPPSVPNPVPRSSRRTTTISPAPFANDPLRGPTLSPPPLDEIEKLNGNHFLTTSLLDYIMQCGLPNNLPETVLIGSSNSLSWFESMNKKSDKNASSHDADGAKILRHKYQSIFCMSFFYE